MNLDPTGIAQQWYDLIEQAWNAGDGFAFGEAFTEPCDFVDIRGVHHRGQETIADGHREIFESIYRDSVIRYRVEDARCLDDETIIAHGTGELDAPNAPPPVAGGATARSTVVLLRNGPSWRCTAMHNTLLMTQSASA